MGSVFDIRLLATNGKWFWFSAKDDKYFVRINTETKEQSCDCLGDVFQRGGRKQKDCKHVRKAVSLLKALGKIPEDIRS